MAADAIAVQRYVSNSIKICVGEKDRFSSSTRRCQLPSSKWYKISPSVLSIFSLYGHVYPLIVRLLRGCQQ